MENIVAVAGRDWIGVMNSEKEVQKQEEVRRRLTLILRDITVD